MDADWLKLQFELHKDHSKSELAVLLGLDSPAISKILSGTRQIKAREYELMRGFFGLPVYDPDSLKMATSRKRKTGSLPTSSSFAVAEKPSDSSIENWLMPSTLRASRARPVGQVRIFTVPDNLMAPGFRQGETVLIDLEDHDLAQPGVFLVSDGFGTMIRRCALVAGQKGAVRLTAPDKTFQPTTLNIEDFEILGRVVGKVAWTE